MAFVHGHARDAGWVVSHYRRPQCSGDGQLDLELPTPRTPADPTAPADPDREPAEPTGHRQGSTPIG